MLNDHTGYPEITNATENNKRKQSQYIGSYKYLTGNNLPRIKLTRGKLFPDTYYALFPSVDFFLEAVSRVHASSIKFQNSLDLAWFSYARQFILRTRL